MKRLFLIVILFLVIPRQIFAGSITPSDSRFYKSYDYVIDSYNIDIVVNENNTFDIKEEIEVYFNVGRHGIYRTLPLRTNRNNRVKVSDLVVDNEYTTAKLNNNYIIKIGNSSYVISGKEDYLISYNYNIGEDPLKGSDEFYFNIIGNGWDTVIGNVSFTITMPKEFDSSKISFYSGKVGSASISKNVSYSVLGNVISGSYNGIINPNESVTVKIELEEGYFKGENVGLDISYYICIVPILFLLVAIYLFFRYGRDSKGVETVEFYPPNGLNSLDMAYIYKGKVNSKDVISLLVYLANKGYFDISDVDDKDFDRVNLNDEVIKRNKKRIKDLEIKLEKERIENPHSDKIRYYENAIEVFKNIDKPVDYDKYGVSVPVSDKKGFVLKKKKDYDGDDINEQWFMEGLFEHDRDEVTSDTLKTFFYERCNNIVKNVNNIQNKDKIFNKKASNRKSLIIWMIVVLYCFITIMPLIGNFEFKLFHIIFTILCLGIFIGFSFGGSIYFNILDGFAYGLGWVLVLWSLITFDALGSDDTYELLYFVGLVCIGFMFVIYIFFRSKRTKYGSKMIGKIRGFKNFLEVCEKDKLEMLVMENPNYFYDILPYTYVLGLSDIWIKKFESISIERPLWYPRTSNVNYVDLINNVNVYVNNLQNSVVYNVSSLGGSSSGSSGGGSGGGGGGSW